ncbi:hypothetical protein [Natronoglycomyces albus]|uniref:Uncharacterized protein n=1 Tax=Natronoglycomyces albus TaxID=2811108 RepID=A0A895XPE8_9ACTN|nr:hypothetical protein [Natronoglycomyces albus]QSB05622.1 hypothetical protein JQS30_01445 [Natronoglycomyces albus]
MIELSDSSASIAGIVLLTIVTIEFGGAFLLRIVRGQVPMTEFQKSFARAGHAHAGVLVTLGLVCLVLADATDLAGFAGWIARVGVPASAIFISAGFFLSSLGKGTTAPNKLIALIWIGAAFLAAGTLTLGVGLLTV